ncbi:undecaprenyl-diphosphatase [Novosphingobium chloroacetimidivorans]|uniref:Undecaprenyl-diphosphatase n=1 Tax=Novosphingobium chloroacetimidivorans TaxID=1428314 RepID=A0A7W7KCM8_9SPHN|nr:phosphatase PAP2 family protein [Novosphingobium chloroacetimidivorans]MBB4859768.1 undecaprenyl-diphosphatase [Novosphingobium chloroacetimidivorans]
MASQTEIIAVPKYGHRLDPRKSLGVALVCWTAFVAIAWSVAHGQTTAIDEAGMLLWRGADLLPGGPRGLAEGVRDLTALGGVLLRNLIAIMAVVALLFIGLRREALLLALTVVLAWVVNSGIKHLVGRPRPQIVPHLMEAGGNSFPSGHSFNSAVVYVSIALALAALSRRRSVRMTITMAALAISLVIAWSRVWLGVHWPSDVLAGWLGGVGWAFLASALLYRPAKAAVEAVSEPEDSPSPPTVH